MVGVAPYLDVEIEDEDSPDRGGFMDRKNARVDIAVIRTPRISNFTDFMLLENLNGVSLRYVDHPSKLGSPDMIILPGTKNTMEDLRWMRQERAGSQSGAGSVPGNGNLGNLRRIPDAGRYLKRPGGDRGRRHDERNGAASVGDHIYKGKDQNPGGWKIPEGGGILAGLEGISFEGYEIHMGETRSSLPAMSEIKNCARKQEFSQRTRQSMDGVSRGTYMERISMESLTGKTW